MKAKIAKNTLESAVSRCYDSCEKKSSESVVHFSFKNSGLTLTAKGGFSFYEELLTVSELDDEADFCLKTSTVLEFLKYISTDLVVLVFDENKKSCLITTPDKKSKLALQVLDIIPSNTTLELSESVNFDIENPSEFLSKLFFASKFCSSNFQDHPLTGIYCKLSQDNFEVKATSGATYYSSSYKINCKQELEFYLPKKSPQMLKNIFVEYPVKTCKACNRYVVFESNNCKLTLFVEQSGKDSFPNQIQDVLDQEAKAKLKISSYELSKTLKFFNGIFPEGDVNFSLKDDVLTLVSKETTLAAKEIVPTEECSGEASSAYISKMFLECLESLQASWIVIEFLNMTDEFYLLKLTSGETLILLCPTT